MPFSIIRDNIVTISADAIVNAANSSLREGGGVCGAIFAAAGRRQLQEECSAIGYCAPGHAVMTKGYQLPASYIIHTVGPVWQGGQAGEEDILRSCYQSSLQLAVSHSLASIAFPLISSGIFGYPKEQALCIAVDEIKKFQEQYEKDLDVILVIFDRRSFRIGKELHFHIQEYIDDRCTAFVENQERERFAERNISLFFETRKLSCSKRNAELRSGKKSLEDCIRRQEESFSVRLLRLIDESGKTDVQVYKKANIDRKHFSKIRSNPDYVPSKKTVLSFAIALELNLDDAKDLLATAGYALSRSSKFDIILEYYLENQIYDIFEINEVLFAFEQPLLN